MIGWVDDIAKLLGVIAVAISVLSIVYAWWTARMRANRSLIEQNRNLIGALDDRMNSLERRYEVTAEKVQHLPDKNDLNVLHDRITNVFGVVQELKGSVDQMNSVVRRINQHLMDRSN